MKQPSALTTAELIKRKLLLKGATIAFIIVAVFASSLCAYLYFFTSKSISLATLIPLFALPITWIPLFIAMKSINDEIQFRQKATSI